MKNLDLFKRAGLIVSQDSALVLHVRVGPAVPARIRRAAAAIKSVLASRDVTPGLAAASLVLLDGVSPLSLPKVSASLSGLFTWRELMLIDWREVDPPRWERRAISARTLHLVTQAGLLEAAAEVNLLQALSDYLAGHPAYSAFPAKERVSEFHSDVLCWWFQALPMPLFFHVSGLQPLSAVARSTLATADRQEVPAPQRGDVPEQEVERLDELDSCAEVLDLAEASEGADSNSALLRQVLHYVSSNSDAPPYLIKRLWVTHFLGLRLQAASVGPISCLLLAWAIDLIESGTQREANLALGTVRAYLQRAMLPLFEAAIEFPDSPDAWDVDVLTDVYHSLVLSQSAGNRRVMAAALTSFHDFLVKWFDTPPLPRSLHSDIPSPEVRAVVIWDHQVHLAQAWIQHISQDVLLRTALQVALAISAEQPSRVKEVLFLKLGNVHDFGEWIEIEIAPRWRKDGLKTTASQRRLTIIHPARMLTIRDWVRAKKTAGLGQRALLFCGPHDHQSIYRRSDMNRALNKLLRAVSGEPKAVTHSMRHAGVSRQAEPVLASSSRPGIDRWRALAAESGHATPVTTLGVYTNLYESPLRQWLTVAVLRQLPLTSHEIAVLSGFDPAALRQRASRAGLSSVEFAWRACAYPMPPSGLPDAATAFDMVLPQSPMPLDSIAPELTPGVTLLLLERLAAGQSPSQVAADFMLAVKVVECLDELARALALELAKSFWPRRSARTGVPLELPSALDLLRLHVADASHPKLAPLRQYLLLNPTDETLLGRAAESWLICRRGEYLAVDSPRAIVDLYRLLLTSGMNPAAVRLCLRDASRGSSNVELASRVCTDFLSVFGVKPSIFDAAARERVPQAYVQLDQADGEASTGRGGSIGGLDVLMFAVLAHLRWISREAQ